MSKKPTWLEWDFLVPVTKMLYDKVVWLLPEPIGPDSNLEKGVGA